MSQQPIDIVVKVQQLTAQAFEQVQRELKKLEDQASKTGKGSTASLQAATQQTSLWGSAIGQVKTVAAGFVAGFALTNIVSSISNAVSSTIDWAGSITDLSSKIGVSTTALQRWEFAGGRVGISIDTIVMSAQELGKRINEGEDSTVGALNQLGIKLDDIRKMGPEQQFETVAGALMRVKDAGQFTALAVDLLGKSGKQVIPVLKGDLKAVGDEAERLGAVVNEETIGAMDDLGDTFGDLKLIGRGLLSEVLEPMVPVINDIAGAMKQLNQPGTVGFFESYAMASGNPLLLQAVQLWNKDNLYNLKRTTDMSLGGPDPAAAAAGTTQTEAQRKAAEKAAEAARKLRIEQEAGWAAAAKHMDALYKESRALQAMSNMARDAAQGIDSLNKTRTAGYLMMSTAGLPEVVDGLPDTLFRYENQVSTPGINGAQVPYGSSMLAGPSVSGFSSTYGWGNIAKMIRSGAIPQQLVGAFTGGGNIGSGLGSIAGGLGGSALGGMFSGIASSGFLSAGMATTFGALGSVLPVVGTIAGAALGKAISGLLNRGPSQNTLATRQRNQYLSQFSGDEFNQQFRDAQIDPENARRLTEALMGAKTESAAKQAIDAINIALERNTELLQDQEETEANIVSLEERRAELVASLIPTADQLASIVAKYGLNVDGLGTSFNQIGATDTWTKMLNDIDKLNAASADVGGYMIGMADDINALVAQSEKLGTKIPENMRPYIQNLIDAGLLLDANGDKITDITTLNWGEAVQTDAQKTEAAISAIDELLATMKTSLQEIVDMLRGAIPAAAAAGASGVEDAFNRARPTIRVTTEYDGAPTSDGYATGGLVSTPQIAPIAEREPEMIGPVNFMERALAGALKRAGRGWGTFEVPVYLDGRLVARGVAPYLPEAAR